MDNLQKIFAGVQPIDHRSSKNSKKHKIHINGEYFSSTSIHKILEHIKFIIENDLDYFHLKIIINTKCIADEATLIVFEMLLYYLLKNNICNVTYTFIVDKSLLGYEHFRTSNLYKYNTKIVNSREFIQLFEKKTYINQNHFRKICINNEENKKGVFLSVLFSDISTFLSTYNIEESYVMDLSETITEIVGNSLEHSDGDCILDIKIAIDKVNNYKNINVTTITVCDTLLSTNVKEYIENANKKSYSPRNEIVLQAYENHKNFFCDTYDIDTFSTISAFQKYVTTRKNVTQSGGTGLTTLIKQLKTRAKNDYCYVLSGNDVIYFKEPFLDLTEDGLIGFNEDNNYLSDKPCEEIVFKGKNRFNGTIYNLSFILDERKNEDE